MRLNHIEISVPATTLIEGFAEDLDRLLKEGFGWSRALRTVGHPTLGPSVELSYDLGGPVRLVLREARAALQPGVEDHLGFGVDSEELDRLYEHCISLSRRNRRVELAYVEDGRPFQVNLGEATYRTFLVQFLLPVWFQFETYQPNRTVQGQS